MTRVNRLSKQLRRMQVGGRPFIGLRQAMLLMAVAMAATSALAAERPADFREVYDLIRTNLPGVTAEEFDRQSVKALVNAFGPNVMMGAPAAPADAPLISRTEVFDKEVLYVRVPEIREGLNLALRQAIDKAAVSNKLKGLALDFRYANGQDFAAAASVVDLFVGKEKPLLNVGGKALKSAPKQDAVNLPVAVLVNRETAGAPEAAAALFRETATGLLLGSQTAGQTASLKDYPLSNGEKIRIASEPVLLGDGSPLSAKGVMPDILVSVNAASERAWFADAFAAIPSGSSASATNAASVAGRPARRPRISEADLVRERREGIPLEELDARAAEPDKPQIADPALARAVDLLKGLAVVRRTRP